MPPRSSVAVAALASALVSPRAALAGGGPVGAEIRASSSLGRGNAHAAWRAFDADINTAWCQAAADDVRGGTLVVRFAQPVTVRAIEVAGAEPKGPDPDSPRPALALTVTTDAGAVSASFDAWAEDPAVIAAPAGATRSVSFHLGPRPAGKRRAGDTCLSEIQIHLDEGPLVYGVPPAALAALPAALTALDDALQRCDRKRLARLARFPVGLRETAMGGRRAYPTGPGTDTDPRAFRRPRDLPCTWSTRHGERAPVLDGGIAPGVVRVDGGEATATVYWELAWRARRWQLISFDSVWFE